jgi:hypothetical protein
MKHKNVVTRHAMRWVERNYGMGTIVATENMQMVCLSADVALVCCEQGNKANILGLLVGRYQQGNDSILHITGIQVVPGSSFLGVLRRLLRRLHVHPRIKGLYLFVCSKQHSADCLLKQPPSDEMYWVPWDLSRLTFDQIDITLKQCAIAPFTGTLDWQMGTAA